MDLISWNHKVATFFASSLRASARLSLGDGPQDAAVLAGEGAVGSTNQTLDAFGTSATPPTGAAPGAPQPDLIVVLEESTFDLRSLLARSDPTLDNFFEPPQGKYGRLRVHTFGGGTWLAEFGLLTAIPHVEFGPNGDYAPFLLEGRIHDSLPLHLNRLGYQTIAAYSSGGNFVNARRFYTSIGFRHFLDPSQLTDGRDWRWRTPDSEILISALQALTHLRPPSDSRPAFLMTLTLNQHGPHGPTKVGRDLVNRFSAGLVHGGNAAKFGEYLARLKASAEAISVLKDEYRRLFPGRPVIFLHFGDHHPDISRYLVPNGISNEEDELDAQNLPDVVRTTYFSMESLDFELKPSSMDKMTTIDIAYLGVNLLQSAGLGLDSTWKKRAMLAVACEGQYAECRSPLKALLHQHLLSSGLVTE
jgi:phosphoglycerol transferase MdoB-like AlkP superfamily enzyme